MAKFVCNSCRYRFESREDQWKKTCPYCARPTVEPEQDANSLLDDVLG